jgi:hypothetical protein
MNTVLNNLNQLIVIAIVTIAIIAAVVYVLTVKHRSNSIETTAIAKMPQIRVADLEDDRNRLMAKYAISCDNNRFVWGLHTFDTLEDAVKSADAFVDKISVDFRLPIQAF